MSLIIIRPPQSVAEYQEACAMVERVYREAGYFPANLSMQHPKAILIATRDSSLLGSIGIVSGVYHLLPTEKAFSIVAHGRDGDCRENLLEAVRLVVKERQDSSILKGLIAGMILHAIQSVPKRTWWMTVKPTLAKVLSRYCHLTYESFEGSPTPEAFDAAPGYWASAPAPIAIRISQERTDAAFLRLSSDLEGKVIFDLEDFDHHRDYGNALSYADSKTRMELAV